MHERTQPREYRLPRNYLVVGEYLKELREKSGMTQREVSLALGYSSAQFISNFERGISLPPLKKLKTLQELYNGNVNKLIELTIESERVILGQSLRGANRAQSVKRSKRSTQ